MRQQLHDAGDVGAHQGFCRCFFSHAAIPIKISDGLWSRPIDFSTEIQGLEARSNGETEPLGFIILGFQERISHFETEGAEGRLPDEAGAHRGAEGHGVKDSTQCRHAIAYVARTASPLARFRCIKYRTKIGERRALNTPDRSAGPQESSTRPLRWHSSGRRLHRYRRHCQPLPWPPTLPGQSPW